MQKQEKEQPVVSVKPGAGNQSEYIKNLQLEIEQSIKEIEMLKVQLLAGDAAPVDYSPRARKSTVPYALLCGNAKKSLSQTLWNAFTCGFGSGSTATSQNEFQGFGLGHNSTSQNNVTSFFPSFQQENSHAKYTPGGEELALGNQAPKPERSPPKNPARRAGSKTAETPADWQR